MLLPGLQPAPGLPLSGTQPASDTQAGARTFTQPRQTAEEPAPGPAGAPGPFWAQQQNLAQQLLKHQAVQQQAAMAAMLPGLAAQLQGAPFWPVPAADTGSTSAADEVAPEPAVTAAAEEWVRRRARPGTYSTRGLQGGYSTRG